MKINKTALFVITAGVAAAGVLAYLMGTEDGKKKMKKLQKKGGQALENIDGLAQKAKEKFEGIHEFFGNGCANDKSKAGHQQESA